MVKSPIAQAAAIRIPPTRECSEFREDVGPIRTKETEVMLELLGAQQQTLPQRSKHSKSGQHMGAWDQLHHDG